MKATFAHLIVAFVALCLASGGYLFWYQMVTSESTRAAGLLQEIEIKTETEKRADAALAALSELTEKQGAVEEYFISEGNVVSFLEELEAIGLRAGAVVRVVSVGAPVNEFGEALPITLSVEGTFDAVMRTVGAIEHAPYSIVIATLSLSRGLGGEEGRWSASVKVTAGSTLSATPKTSP